MEHFILLSTAAGIGVAHTVLGPDHYVPFIAMSRAGKWSLPKTLLVTVLCGAGHVGSSAFIALLGVLLGYTLGHFEIIQSYQSKIAAWLLIGFGLAYFVWGLRHAHRKHSHHHGHGGHSHDGEQSPTSLTPWVLFTIFIFGPCEALIPLLMYPAAKASAALTTFVIAAFACATLVTMILVVGCSCLGLRAFSLGKAERFGHAVAGIMIFLCGAGIEWLGW